MEQSNWKQKSWNWTQRHLKNMFQVVKKKKEFIQWDKQFHHFK